MVKIIVGVLCVVLVVGAGYWYFSPKTYTITPVSQETATTTPPAVAPATATTSPQTITTNNQAPIMQATLHTSMGDITIEFLSNDAPNTVANFIKLAQSGFYDGT